MGGVAAMDLRRGPSGWVGARCTIFSEQENDLLIRWRGGRVSGRGEGGCLEGSVHSKAADLPFCPWSVSVPV